MPLNPLTKRELEVLELLIPEAADYTKMATILVIAETTLKTHINNIFQKLQVTSKVEAIVAGCKLGLITMPGPEEATDSIVFI